MTDEEGRCLQPVRGHGARRWRAVRGISQVWRRSRAFIARRVVLSRSLGTCWSVSPRAADRLWEERPTLNAGGLDSTASYINQRTPAINSAHRQALVSVTSIAV